MTREEAIKFANCLKNNYTIDFDDMGVFCDMAIEALEMVEEFEKAQIISSGRLNGRTYAYKCGLEDGKRKALKQQPNEDCVSRQAVLEKINDWWGITLAAGEPSICDYIRELPSVAPTQKWIPVSEELPKEHIYDDGFVDPSEPVLVQLNNKDMKVSRYWGSREKYKDEPWIDLSYPTTLEVIAWMPLPEPYKVEMESEDDR